MAHFAIIGAGPAGTAASIHLARAGHAVTLIEKKAFPRVKVCGEYVSPAATDALEAVLSPDELIAAGARRVSGMALELDNRTIDWPTPRAAWCLSRKALDDVLVAKARSLGVDVHQPCAVRRVEYGEDGVVVHTDVGPVDAMCAVHADGVGRHCPAGATPMGAGIVGFKCHYRPAGGGVAGVRMRAARGAYIGTIGVEDGLATCALVARGSLVKQHSSNADALVRDAWPAWDPERRETDWLSCGVARSRYIEPGHARSVRLGNAAAAVDPIGGEGIGLALWSAREFAAAFRGDLGATKRRLAAAYRNRLLTRRWACRGAAEALMRPGLIRAVWPVLGRRGEGSAAMGVWYRLSGKPG